MFAAINVCVFAKQTSSLLLLMFLILVMRVRESKGYNFLCAIYVCEFVKIAKFANINHARTFVDLQ